MTTTKQTKKKDDEVNSTSTSTTTMEQDIMSILTHSQHSTAKQIRKALIQLHTNNGNDENHKDKKPKRKRVEQTLQKMIKDGSIEKVNGDDDDDYRYRLLRPSNDDDANDDSTDGDSSSFPLPFAELMRRRTKSKSKSEMKNVENDEIVNAVSGDAESALDYDEEIRRLEAELAAASDDDSDADSFSSSHDNNHPNNDNDYGTPTQSTKQIRFGDTTILNPPVEPYTSTTAPDGDANVNDADTSTASDSGGIICLSEYAQDRIIPLPSSALPTSKTRMLKVDKEGTSSSSLPSSSSSLLNPKNKKRRRQTDNAPNTTSNNNTPQSTGLHEAVKEVLSGYIARSSEKIPFYCRVCQHTSANEMEFQQHKQTEFHKVAVQAERKASKCNLCRKQFTSVIQLREHLMSRPHKEKMDWVKYKQRGGGRGSGGFGGGRGGKGHMMGRGGGRGSFRGTDQRQWC